MGSTSYYFFFYFVPQTSYFKPRGPEKNHANISNPVSASNVRESPKCSRLLGNQGGGTRWWRQILDRK